VTVELTNQAIEKMKDLVQIDLTNIKNKAAEQFKFLNNFNEDIESDLEQKRIEKEKNDNLHREKEDLLSKLRNIEIDIVESNSRLTALDQKIIQKTADFSKATKQKIGKKNFK
jgi:hypothetical protein